MSNRLSKPRVAPAERSALNPDQADLAARFGEGPVLNVFGTLLHHPGLFRRWLPFANHILGKSTLTVRDRELLILRTAWRVRSEYEWGQHVLIARNAGMSDADIAVARSAPNADGLENRDQLLLAATDELLADTFVTDSTWVGLADFYSTQQILDIVFTVGQYNMLAMALNSLGVQRDEGVPGFDG